MTIHEYLKTKNITLRELARRLEISATYLSDLRDGKRISVSEKVANNFERIAPEITIIKETKSVFKLGGIKPNE